MTDTELLHEVEQAMLGAMMTRPRRAGGLPGPVTPELFTDRRHQAIVAALTGTAGEERGLFGWVRGWFARHGRRAREDRAYLETLPDLCPDATHMASYFEILSQAREQRHARTHEAMNRAADAAQLLTGAADQLAIQTGAVGPLAAPGELPASVAREARALANYARHLSQTGSTAPAQPDRPRRSAPAPAQPSQPAARWALAPQAASGRAAPDQTGQPVNGQVMPAPQTQETPSAPRPVLASGSSSEPQRPATSAGPQLAATKPVQITRREAQELLLAALMRDGDLAREIMPKLSPDLFDEGPRRELYTMIGESVEARRPVDPLLIAWAADQRTSADPEDGRESWVSSDYVRNIATLPPAPGNPMWLGQMLRNDSANVPASSQDDAPEPDPQPEAQPHAKSAPEPETASVGKSRPQTRRAPRSPQRPSAPANGGPAPGQVIEPPPEPAQPGVTPTM